MKSSPCFISMIPDDILLEILNFLPFESLHKCRWVSRSWHSLITHELFAKIIKFQFLGFFHRIGTHNNAFSYIERGTDDDPGLDFLPCAAPTLTLLDCCNDLILYQAWELDAYYVCNPVNSSWTVVKGCEFTPNLILLDFDPWVSPYFMLVAFAVRPTSVLVSMYCSETKRWAEKRVEDCRVCVGGFPRVGRCTLWKRALYMDAILLEEDCKIIKFKLLEGDVGFETVEFPKGTKMPRGVTYIGRLEDKLCFAGLDGLQLRVWILSSEHENRWVRVHKGYICSPGGCVSTLAHIVGFHSMRSAVLIFFDSAIFAYDLVELSFMEICHIGSKVLYCTPVLIFPFLTCSSTLLENRRDHQG